VLSSPTRGKEEGVLKREKDFQRTGARDSSIGKSEDIIEREGKSSNPCSVRRGKRRGSLGVECFLANRGERVKAKHRAVF